VGQVSDPYDEGADDHGISLSGLPGEPLDAERDQVAYDLGEWDDEAVAVLEDRLAAAGIPYAWDGAELFVYEDDEEAVDAVVDELAGDELPLDAGDEDDAVDAELLGDVFVAADRLRRDPQDPDGVMTVLEEADRLDPGHPPYGLDRDDWHGVCERFAALRDLLLADTVDEDAVVAGADELRRALRPYV
jgi:hypothetical protein